MSNCFDPDRAEHFIRPDLSPNCLQRFSADDIGIISAVSLKLISVYFVILASVSNHLCTKDI